MKPAVLLMSTVVAVVVAGCGPINAGADASADVARWIGTPDGVADVTVSGQNHLPYSALVDATITMDPSATPAQRVDVATHALAYDSRHGTSIDLTWTTQTGVAVSVALGAGDPAPSLDTAAALATVPGATDVHVEARWQEAVEIVTGDDTAEAVHVFDTAAELMSSGDLPLPTPRLQVSTPSGSVDLKTSDVAALEVPVIFTRHILEAYPESTGRANGRSASLTVPAAHLRAINAAVDALPDDPAITVRGQ